jgi:uncharacterized protein YrrD
MLLLGSHLINMPILSIKTGSELARTSRPIIDPSNLKIIAYELDGALLSKKPSYILTNDIRELSEIGMIVDDDEEIIGYGDVISLDKLIDLNFNLINMKVFDVNHKKIGKVKDYVLTANFYSIEQIDVKSTGLSSFTDTGRLIHRSQIVEINNNYIIIKKDIEKIAVAMKKTIQDISKRSYDNPFRSTDPQVEQEV